MSRWVEFAGIDNVRDLGGLPVAGNRRTRFGMAFRSSTPQGLTTDDLDLLLGTHGLRTVIDLRLPEESEREGWGLLGSIEAVSRVSLPLTAERVDTGEAMVPAARLEALARHYFAMLDGSTASFLAAARLIADQDRHAVLFHCAAGKDRTGVLAAVLLTAVGVPVDAVAADYALTAEKLVKIRARLAALPSYQDLPQVTDAVMDANPAVMHRFLTLLQEEHGSAAEWLAGKGFTAAELDLLTAALVEPADTDEADRAVS